MSLKYHEGAIPGKKKNKTWTINYIREWKLQTMEQSKRTESHVNSTQNGERGATGLIMMKVKFDDMFGWWRIL